MDRTYAKLKNIGLDPSQWKSNAETEKDWNPRGKLMLEAEITAKKRKMGLLDAEKELTDIGPLHFRDIEGRLATIEIKMDAFTERCLCQDMKHAISIAHPQKEKSSISDYDIRIMLLMTLNVVEWYLLQYCPRG